MDARDSLRPTRLCVAVLQPRLGGHSALVDLEPFIAGALIRGAVNSKNGAELAHPEREPPQVQVN